MSGIQLWRGFWICKGHWWCANTDVFGLLGHAAGVYAKELHGNGETRASIDERLDDGPTWNQDFAHDHGRRVNHVLPGDAR